MTHMVIFRSTDGRPGYHQAEDLSEATLFVERLRNEEAVTDSRIFYMQEVPIEFKTYFKVEVVPASPYGTLPAEGPVADAAATVVSGEEASEEGDAPAEGSSGRFGLFSRG